MTLRITFLLLLMQTIQAMAASPPPSFRVRLVPVITGLSQPVGLFHAGDARLFVVEQEGVIRLWKEGRLSLFLDIRDRVIAGGEMGLLGLAFHPQFSKNRRLFVNYTAPSPTLNTVISEFTVGPNGPGGERILRTIPQPYRNHNGGQIAFGPDGYLYIGMGDGGAANDPQGHGQNPASLLGKMLRVDVDRRSHGRPYGIPSDNPFVGIAGTAPEIWALGLRNPWRFSFDSKTGRLFAGDVGQGAREEIDLIQKGKNYGWNRMEGTICTPDVNPNCDQHGLTLPRFDYPRSQGSVVVGGFVYRGREIPGLYGAYVYGDFGNGRIWALRYDDGRPPQLILDTGRNISAFGEDVHGELYVVDYDGVVLRLAPL
jgi:glucose/arabinose dehydrogenase